MVNPIGELQVGIVAALNIDATVVSLIGADGVFDMPPKGKTGKFVTFANHVLNTHDADTCVGNDHRVDLNAWHTQANRASVSELSTAVVSAILGASLSTAAQRVTHVHHVRTLTSIEQKTGRARATITFQVFSEPVS